MLPVWHATPFLSGFFVSILPLLWIRQYGGLRRCALLALAGCIGYFLRKGRALKWNTCFLTGLLAGSLWGSLRVHYQLRPLHWRLRATEWACVRIVRCEMCSSSFTKNKPTLRIHVKLLKVGFQSCRWSNCFARIVAPIPENRCSIALGDEWMMQLRLRPVQSRYRNQGGSNALRTDLAKGILFEGDGLLKKCKKVGQSRRATCLSNMEKLFEPYRYGFLWMALLTGEKKGGCADTKVFLKAGTAHLLAVSGLHINLASRFICFCLRVLLWFILRRRCFFAERCTAWLVAMGSCWLAGCSISSLRAALQMHYQLLTATCGGHWPYYYRWLKVVTTLLWWNPLYILSDSFWLSILATGAIYLTQYAAKVVESRWKLSNRWERLKSKVYQYCWLQLGLTLLLTPFQWFMFRATNPYAPLLNLITIPIFTQIVLPGLLSWISIQYLTGSSVSLLPSILDKVCAVTMQGLLRFADAYAHIQCTLALGVLFCLLAVLFMLFLCGPLRCYALQGLLCWIPFLMNERAGLIQAEFLDVGHGLAVLLRNGNKAILFDTASSYGQTSIATKYIIPYLKYTGIDLQGLVLSHDDLDHVGGVEACKAAYPDLWIRSPSYRWKGIVVVAGTQWSWNSLNFQVLWPHQPFSRVTNKNSCVLQVTTQGGRKLLLTGDLEKSGENRLLRQKPDNLRTHCLQVPHHGSLSSSSVPFLVQVQPDFSVVSARCRQKQLSQFRKLLDTYCQLGYPIFSTEYCGRIGWVVDQFNRQGCYCVRTAWYDRLVPSVSCPNGRWLSSS